MAFVVLIHATFENKADADHIFNQSEAVATNASVALIGQVGERTSYCSVSEEQPDGSLVVDRQWNIDRFGIVRNTDPIPYEEIPPWIQPTGVQDAYPLLDKRGNPTRVTDEGLVWENTSPNNTNKPGVFGWVQV